MPCQELPQLLLLLLSLRLLLVLLLLLAVVLPAGLLCLSAVAASPAPCR
jgi:hypothetical protein